MKKIKYLTLILFLLVSLPCFADHYVYLRTSDRPGVTLEDNAGRSKAGDIVDIRYIDYELSEKEKAEWKIIKVSGLTNEQIQLYKEPWRIKTGIDEEGQPIYKTLAYRRKKVNFKAIDVVLPVALKAIFFTPLVSDKTDLDLARYKEGQRKYARFRWLRYFVSRANLYCFIQLAFAETVSTINKTGQDYDTLTLWEDAKDGDLVTETRQETASCYDDDGDLDDNLTINGSTTNSSYYMKVTSSVGERHSGIAGTGFAIACSCRSGIVFTIRDFYTIIEWLEIYGTNSLNRCIYTYPEGGRYQGVRNNLCHTSNVGIYIWSQSGYVNNNIVYNTQGDGIFQNGLSYWTDINGNTVYNYNLANDGSQGIQVNRDDTDYVVKNNLVVAGTNGGDCFLFAVSTIHDYNASSDATADGANSINSGSGDPPTTADFVSVTGGSENLHLSAGAPEIDIGVDLGTTNGVNFDIDNRDRDAEGDTWDIGADEYVSAAVSIFQPIINIF